MANALVRLGTLVIVLAACGSSSGPTTAATAPNAFRPDLVASCGAVVFPDPVRPDLPATALDDDAAGAIDQVRLVAEGEAAFFDDYEWFIADRTATSLVLFGTPLFPPPAGSPPYATASFARDGDVWRPEGWGQCRIEIDAPGFGSATWVLDPAIEPHPDATELNILINERDCASGQPPVGRDVVPVVALDADSVTITVLVEPVAGDSACPSNPWHKLTVDLGEPLGERVVRDGSQSPSLQRAWPPSQTSIDSFGREQ